MIVAQALWMAIKASRYAQIGLAALAVLLGWHTWLAVHDRGVRRDVVARVERQSEAIAAKATTARAAANKPGAVDRLRKRYGEGL